MLVGSAFTAVFRHNIITTSPPQRDVGRVSLHSCSQTWHNDIHHSFVDDNRNRILTHCICVYVHTDYRQNLSRINPPRTKPLLDKTPCSYYKHPYILFWNIGFFLCEPKTNKLNSSAGSRPGFYRCKNLV